MKMPPKKPTITIANANAGQFQCRACNGTWFAAVTDDNRLRRGSLICPHCGQHHKGKSFISLDLT